MRYVPNLLPATSKVLPDYFKGNIYKPAKKNTLVDIIMWLLGILFFIFALVNLNHFLLFLLLGFLGFMLIPPGHRFLEKKLRFRLAPRIKAVAASALFFCSVPVSSHYDDIDRKAALQVKQAEEKSAKEKEIAAQKDQQRKDSLAWYIQQSNQLASAHKLDDANQLLQKAQAFVVTQEERDQVANQQVGIKSITALVKVKAGEYEDALSEIEGLLLLNPSNRELQYNKALCKSKMGNIQEAVTDLKPLLAAEYPDAVTLHNKINPVRKRITGTCTRCCDGSTSYATGRGACSHHGGVCNWNEPIYEESRKYE